MSFVIRCVFTVIPSLVLVWSRKEMGFPKGVMEWMVFVAWFLVASHFAAMYIVHFEGTKALFCFVLSVLICFAMEHTPKIGAKFRRR